MLVMRYYLFIVGVLFAVGLTSLAAEVRATEKSTQESRESIDGSGYPLPRFMTLKSSKVNMRLGPGSHYPVKWVYRQKGLPLKVTREHHVWREVTDHHGEKGWMHLSTLTLQHSGVVLSEQAEIRTSNIENSRVVAIAKKGVMLKLVGCEVDYCQIRTRKIRGWIKKNVLWGVFPDEVF